MNRTGPQPTPDPTNRREYEAAAREVLAPLLKLEPNWDSYDGQPITAAAAARALEILVELAMAKHPAPMVVPTSSGGICLEWQAHDLDLTIDIEPDGVMVGVYFADDATGEDWELSLVEAQLRLPTALARLAVKYGVDVEEI